MKIKTLYEKWNKFFFSMWGIFALVYSFIICHFWWGNHDWKFIKYGVKFNSGFFEGRYSQHFFNCFLFDGQILPILLLVLSLAMIVIMGIMCASYFNLAKDRRYVTVLTLFIGLNPYLFSLIYYQHYLLALTIWPILAIWLLMMTEKGFSWLRLLCGCIGYGILWGGYSPVLALSCCLFGIKNLCECRRETNSWKQSIRNGVFFVIQSIIGFLIYKIICFCLQENLYLNNNMYNLAVRTDESLWGKFAENIWAAFSQFGHLYLYLNKEYALFLILGLLAALICWGRQIKTQRLLALCWLVEICIGARLVFIFALHAAYAEFRLEYWSRLGMGIFMLTGLLFEKKNLWKNLVNLGLCLMFLLWVKTDLVIQKDWLVGWDGYRKYQARLGQRMEMYSGFDKTKHYTLFTLGMQNFSDKFYPERNEFLRESKEMENHHSFNFETGPNLFWEDKHKPFDLSCVNLGQQILIVPTERTMPPLELDFEDIKNIREWLYFEADVYPNINFLYVKDGIVVLVLDENDFNLNREKMLKNMEVGLKN